MKIAISAGHHPARPGAKYRSEQAHFVEHTEALMWQKLIAAEFGSEALLVRPDRLPLKVADINADPDVVCAVEIHFNAAVNSHGDHVGKGSETLYSPGSDNGRRLARCVQERLAGVFYPDRGIKEGWHRMDRPGVEDFPGDADGDEVPNYFLRATRMPAIIVEPDFVHRYALIRGLRLEGCAAIAEGVQTWISRYR